MVVIIAAPMIWGFLYLFVFDAFRRGTSATQLLGNALLAIFFGLPFFIVIRHFIERAFASQQIIVRTGVLAWSRTTKLWSRNHEVPLSDVADVVADLPAIGEHGVRIVKSNGRRRRIMGPLSTESAIATAKALKGEITRLNGR